jgi:hypothetical protein
VKPDIFGVYPVNLGFRLRYPGKNIQRPFFRPPTDPGILYKAANLLPGIMRMFPWLMPVMFFTALGMITVDMITVGVIALGMLAVGVIAMMMIMVMPRFMVMRNAAGPVYRAGIFRQFHHPLDTGDPPPFGPVKTELPARRPEFFQFPPQRIRINAQVNQGPQDHIAGNTGVTIKM